MLNDHYAKIPTDPHYACPRLKCTASNDEIFFLEYQVFRILDQSCPTTAEYDCMPTWYLRLAASCISLPIANLFNRSLHVPFIPDSWKISIIHPIPKVTPPTSCADFRPISITPILCRILEKLVVRSFIYPLFELPQCQEIFKDQFAFRPTGSTTAALTSCFTIFQTPLQRTLTYMLSHWTFLKPLTQYDTALADKLAPLPLPDCIYNWLLNFLSRRKHCTKYAGLISQLAEIIASFVQRSGTAPTSFVINMSDLKALILNNFLLRYADDIDLVIPPTNADTIETELQGISDWAAKNNLALNYAKSHHIVIRRPRFPRDHESNAGVNSIQRVYEMKVLGVTFTDTLSISPHVKYLTSKSAQLSFALRTFRAHGLSGGAVWAVSQAHIISRLTYAAPAWWGFCNMGERDQLQAIVSRLVKRNYLPSNQPPLHEFVATADLRLFNSIVNNPYHVLYPLIPPSKSYNYNLRKRSHNLQLPPTLNSMSDKNFINRILLNLNTA